MPGDRQPAFVQFSVTLRCGVDNQVRYTYTTVFQRVSPTSPSARTVVSQSCGRARATDETLGGVYARGFAFPAAGSTKVDLRASGGVSNVNFVSRSRESVYRCHPSLDQSLPWAAGPLPLVGAAVNLTGPPAAIILDRRSERR